MQNELMPLLLGIFSLVASSSGLMSHFLHSFTSHNYALKRAKYDLKLMSEVKARAEPLTKSQKEKHGEKYYKTCVLSK